ncbi:MULTISPECIES: GumC family protein [Pseudomonas]|uniref:GumC family protein n=1 Tax=Pseudomonas TaxID=286 RepID=UPI000B35969F|nr:MULTISPECIES: polysaccharide biosynthesis tyrosine autokinase [Pseudomonas]PMY48937.1 lipopolysaccharide biosynthesis protein [Pseudomonas sp. FW305-53]PMY84688.1 lipopolysaccharide biosynthesis protein [Pseudomonas sp. FW303-C2]PMY90490.1 lipopolysaccharide biosynthesis protein [Pseudomonas sp. FW305-62]PNA44936.1 lipopolysaccharide biosynthesis protein [Pseudomonas sp. FW306-2-2C-A10BC]PNA83504.1 lipopolysaccharide biosynthesis protein [Pseudomonas sp. MPR-R3B]
MDNSPSIYVEHPLQAHLPQHQQHGEEKDTIDLLKFWRVIWRAHWKIAGLVLLACALAMAILSFIPAQYIGSATLLIKEKTPPLLTFQQVTDSSSGTVDYLQTQLALLQSRDLAERAVKKLNLTTNPVTDPRQQPQSWFTPREWSANLDLGQWWPALDFLIPQQVTPTETDIFNEVTQNLMKRTDVKFVGKSQLLNIEVLLPDPDLAAATANAIAQGFIDSQFDNSLKSSQTNASWMNSRLVELRNNLRIAEDKLQAYREEQGLVDVGGVATISANELEMTGNRMIDARRNLAEAESRYRQVQALSNGDLSRLSSVPAVLSNALVQKFQAQQAKAQAKVEELSGRYGPKHPTLIAALAELRTATDSLRLQVRQVVASIEQDYQLAKASESSLHKSFNSNKTQIQDISRKEFQLRELQREVDSSRALYETFITRLKETAATSDMDSTKARIVDPAIVPLEPSKPRKTLIMVIVAIAAALIGMALALISEARNKTFKTDEAVESMLNIPLLSVVPLVTKRSRRQLARLFDDNEHPRFCETIRNLRTWLMLHSGEKPSQVVLVASTMADEGKSTIANNLAYSLALLERVLLIDADMRRSSLSLNFDFPADSPGLANVLAGTARLEDCIRTVGNLDMLPAGKLAPPPLDLLSSPCLAPLLEALKSRYQRIIIDSPPAQMVSDALLLAKHSDAVIYVIKAESTPVSQVQKCLAILQQSHAPVFGVVLNQVDLRKARKQGYSHSDTFQNYDYLTR